MRLPSLSAGLLLVSTLTAADPLTEAARQAVAARQVRESEFKGTRGTLTPYRELAADGGVLVGLEVGLGGSPPTERVVAVRPVYRVDGRDRTGPPAGGFLSDEVKRSVRLLARDGYAVAAVQVSAGRGIDGLAVRFARIDQAWLRLADSYDSDWVGTAAAEKREWLTGDGRPVVGLVARLDGETVRGLGLTFADLPKPPDPPPAPTPPAPTPTPAVAPKVESRPAAPVRKPGPPPEKSRTGEYLAFGAAVVVPLLLLGYLVVRRGSGGAKRPTARPAAPRSAPPPSRPPSKGLLSILERDDRWR